VRSRDRDVTDAALSRMLRSHVVENRALMEKIGKPRAVVRTATYDDTPEWVESLADRLEAALPPEITAERRSAEGGGVILLLTYGEFEDEHGVAAAIVAPLRDRDGNDWAVAGGCYLTLIGTDDEDESDTDEDDESEAEARGQILGLANYLNDKVAAGAWMLLDGRLSLVAGAALPADEWSDADVQTAAESVMVAAAYGSFAVRTLAEDETEHPAYVRERQNEQLNSMTGSRFTAAEMREALDEYRASLPELLASVTELRHQPGLPGATVSSSVLHVPFPGDGTDHLTTHFLVAADADDEGATHPGGIRIHAAAPERFTLEQATEWCRLLNGGDDDDEEAVTTGWQYGNWYHSPLAGGEDDGGGEDSGPHRVAYYATLPHTARGRIDLAGEIAGAVKEVWASCDRIMFSRRYAGLLQDGATDAKEVGR
jgi:hypothetical protein